MAKIERRKNMPLDEVYIYFRRLEIKLEKASLFKVCNSIRTIDLALSPDADLEDSSCTISPLAWSCIRDELFKKLITGFPGYFLVYEERGTQPLEQDSTWPEKGEIEFYPEKILRRFETYRSNFERIDSNILDTLRWCFTKGEQRIDPELFSEFINQSKLNSINLEISYDHNSPFKLLEKFYEICATEAEEGKKRAHHKWWQLYWEANSCGDKRKKTKLQKEMTSLQLIWGRPAQLV